MITPVRAYFTANPDEHKDKPGRIATDDPRLTEAWRPQPGDADFFFALRVPPALSA